MICSGQLTCRNGPSQIRDWFDVPIPTAASTNDAQPNEPGGVFSHEPAGLSDNDRQYLEQLRRAAKSSRALVGDPAPDAPITQDRS